MNFYDHSLTIQNLPDEVIATAGNKVVILFDIDTTLPINSITLSFISSNRLVISDNNLTLTMNEDARVTLEINPPDVQSEINVTISVKAMSHDKEESVDFNLLIQP